MHNSTPTPSLPAFDMASPSNTLERMLDLSDAVTGPAPPSPPPHPPSSTARSKRTADPQGGAASAKVSPKRRRKGSDQCVREETYVDTQREIDAYDPQTHLFQFQATTSLKMLETVLRMMENGKDGQVNMLVTREGVTLVSFIKDASIYIASSMKASMFEHLRVSEQPTDDNMVVRLHTSKIIKQLGTASKLGTQTIVVRGTAANIEIKALAANQPPVTLSVNQIDDEAFVIPEGDFHYPVTLQIDSKRFRVAVTQMPGNIFTMKVDCNNRQLVLFSSSEGIHVQLPIALDEASVLECLKHEGVKTFSTTFKSSDFEPVVKGVPLNEMMRISLLSSEHPIKVVYLMGDRVADADHSLTTIFIASHNPGDTIGE